MKHIVQWSLGLALMLVLATPMGAQDQETPTEFQTLRETRDQAKTAFEEEQLNYQRVKAVSRDWNRRNLAEEAYVGSFEAYHEAEVAFLTAQIQSQGATRAPAFLPEINFNTTLIFLLGILCMVIIFSDVFLSLAAWMVIKVRPIFRELDDIEVSGVRGKVSKIGFFRTTLLQTSSNPYLSHEAHLVSIPNHLIFKHAVCNYSENKKKQL